MFRLTAWRELVRLIMYEEPEPERIDDWSLARRVEVASEALLRDEKDELGCFFLVLAAVFNDIKGMVLFEQYLNAKGRPLPHVVSEYAGQWRGNHIQIHRWLAGVLFELMIVIRKHRNGLIVGPELAALVASLPRDRRDAWKELVDESLVDGGAKRDRPHDLWQDIRNSASFHYEEKRLARGYLDHFRDGRAQHQTSANEAAMYSPGNTMKTSRFYYADAALQALLYQRGRDWNHDKVDESIVKKASRVNDVLGPMIYQFIRTRTGKPGFYYPAL